MSCNVLSFESKKNAIGKTIIVKLIITILLLFTVGTMYAQTSDSLIVKDYVEQGDKHRIDGEFEKARDYALKALEIDPNYGIAYILIGNLYTSSAKSCSEDSFTKGLVYCLAIDMFEKAKEVDISVTENANRFIEIYSNYLPSLETTFVKALEGDKVKIECWINRETTIRFAPKKN